MADRKKLLQKLSAVQFAAWELHMFLDTHPCDSTANQMFQKYTDEAAMLKREYEAKFGPLTASGSDNADWLCDPWPWDIQGGCD